MRGVAAFLLVAVVPGALLFRAPVLGRDARAQLAAEERAFWWVVISVALSLTVTMALAALEAYRFTRLLWINGGVATAALVAWRARLLYRGTARRPGVTALIPIVLVALGVRFFFPPAEYIIGGKDPGTYMNEGIQIAQRGSLVVRDPVVASVPASARDLFFPSHDNPAYYGTRFMGFYLMDPDAGAVTGQFPQLYPASIAIAYGLDGLTGARRAVGVWGILGLLALYFVGARLVGVWAAAAGAGLLAVNVVQIWFARYPNAELALQALLFAGLLALARAQIDEDRFFEPVAGVLFALLLFLKPDGALAFLAAALAVVLARIDGRRIPKVLVATASTGLVLAAWYWAAILPAYGRYQLIYTRNIGMIPLAGAAIAALALSAVAFWAVGRPEVARRGRTLIPYVVIAVVLVAAGYAYFLRTTGGRTASHDAFSLRTVAGFYLLTPGLVAALVGYVLVVRRSFWRDPAFIIVVTAFALFFFYKMRIVPEHFWMMRRFLTAAFPAAILFAASAAFVGLDTRRTTLRIARVLIGVVFLWLLGHQYVLASEPIRHHVEYAGVIPKLEQLASQFGDEDLVIVESRAAASDVHVLAVPLAYIYARPVLVLNTPTPDKRQFLAFLTWARSRYRDVYFLGGGGTDLLSKSIGIAAVTADRFQVPEYESPMNAYPRRVRQKEFEYGLYRFVNPRAGATWFTLDVGTRDDLHVVRFHSKEPAGGGGTSFRWTRDVSYVSIVNPLPDSRVVTMWMNDGGRPATSAPARVSLTLNGTFLGAVVVKGPFRPYSFEIPEGLLKAAADTEEPARLRIDTVLWNPREALGSGDDRQLGVMVDRIEVR